MTLPESHALTIAVDLIPVRPGGVNGGHKPAIFAILAEASRQMGEEVAWVFLTNSSTHGEIRSLARKQDILICLEEFPNHPFTQPPSTSPSEFKLVPQPPDLIKSLGVDLLYCPFGATYLHAEGTPTLAFIADLLHLDYPLTLTPAQISERKAYIGHTVKVAAMIQCNSRSGVERMMARYGIPEEKLFHTYLPIQLRLDQQLSVAKDFAHEPGLKKPYFFYPANLWAHKNHETLLLAYRLYREHAGSEAWDLVLSQELGIILDLAHLNPAGVDDVLALTTGPLIYSHTNPRIFYDIERNTSDEHIRAVAQRGGVIGVNAALVSTKAEETTLDRYVDNIEYVIDLAGVESVGIGFDFFEFIYRQMSAKDQAELAAYLAEPNFIPDLLHHGHAINLVARLGQRGFSGDDMRKILSDNWMRVFAQVLPG